MGSTQTYNAGPTKPFLIAEQEGDPLACAKCGWHPSGHPRRAYEEIDRMYGKEPDGELHDYVQREQLYRVLDYAAVAGVAFMAVECLTDFPYGKGKVFAAITLFSRGRPPGSITTKNLSESMGVGEVKCPLRILDKLSPVEDLYGPIEQRLMCKTHWNDCVDHPDEEHPGQRLEGYGSAAWAQKWRDDVRAYHAKPKPKAGDVVEFSRPIEFQSGASLKRFRLVKGSTFKSADPENPYGTYRITSWRDLSYSIVEAAQ